LPSSIRIAHSLMRVTAGHAKASDGANMPMQVSVTGSAGLALGDARGRCQPALFVPGGAACQPPNEGFAPPPFGG
jgi:hypothetical protein